MVRLAEAVDPTIALIVETLAPVVEPELVLLFGSRADGEPREDSDYDLMVVFRDGTDVLAQRQMARDALSNAKISADVLARSASDYERRQHDPGCLEWLVSRKGKLLYSSGRMAQASPARVREESPEGKDEWLRRSDADYEITTQTLAVQPPQTPVPDAICFHSHACIEKLLQALIAGGGRFPPRTHDLKTLLALQPDDIRADREIVGACQILQDLYPASRYPELPMPSLDDAKRAFDAARVARDRLRPR